jgi:hypothetical protein
MDQDRIAYMKKYDLCASCTENRNSQVHRDIDPSAVRGPYDIPHHVFVELDSPEAPAGQPGQQPRIHYSSWNGVRRADGFGYICEAAICVRASRQLNTAVRLAPGSIEHFECTQAALAAKREQTTQQLRQDPASSVVLDGNGTWHLRADSISYNPRPSAFAWLHCDDAEATISHIEKVATNDTLELAADEYVCISCWPFVGFTKTTSLASRHPALARRRAAEQAQAWAEMEAAWPMAR